MFQLTSKRSKTLSTDAEVLVAPLMRKPKSSGSAQATLARAFTKESIEIVRALEGENKQFIEKAFTKLGALDEERSSLELYDESKGRLLSFLFIKDEDKQSLDSADKWRKRGANLALELKKQNTKKLSLVATLLNSKNASACTHAFAEGIALKSYEFSSFKGKKSAKKFSLKKIELLTTSSSIKAPKKQELQQSLDGVFLARDLVNTPPSDMNPLHMALQAKRIGKETGMTCKVYDEPALEKMKAGGILGVARGSDIPAKMVHLTFKPTGRAKKKVVLVGKGVTFDSGGLSLKSAKGMMTMKCDMGGASIVMGVMEVLAKHRSKLKLPLEVHGIIPLAENMVNGKSVKPGDVLRISNGKTVEVLNTDAEGRLLLADALSYSSKLKADVLIDMATLTGAVIAALGEEYAGLFTDSDPLAQALLDAASRAGEPLWRMPLAKEYRKRIDSKVADIRNIGSGGGGSITAALFLKEFVSGSAEWAHLDVAGPVWSGSEHALSPAGGTGYGVRTMLEFLKGV